jgi:hypothetical protein
MPFATALLPNKETTNATTNQLKLQKRKAAADNSDKVPRTTSEESVAALAISVSESF